MFIFFYNYGCHVLNGSFFILLYSFNFVKNAKIEQKIQKDTKIYVQNT